MQADAREASEALRSAQDEGARPAAASLRVDLAAVQQQLLEASEAAAAAAASADAFDAQVAALPAAVAAERRRGDAAAGELLAAARAQVCSCFLCSDWLS